MHGHACTFVPFTEEHKNMVKILCLARNAPMWNPAISTPREARVPASSTHSHVAHRAARMAGLEPGRMLHIMHAVTLEHEACMQWQKLCMKSVK